MSNNQADTYFKCKTHNAGPFGIDESSLSSGKILDLHKKRGCEIEYLSDKQTKKLENNDHLDESVKLVLDSILKAEQREKQKDILEEIISLVSKTVKGDKNLVYQILFNGLSAFTTKPTHLMVMEKSSEGKTYPSIQISQYFPRENVIKLGSATPQSFKYDYGISVDKDYNPIEERLDRLEEEIEQAKNSKDHKREKELKKQLGSLLSESKTLIDLRNKWIIFKEPPDSKLLEALYSTLSNDEEYNEHKFVNRSGSGKNQNFTVVLRGCPAILICTSRDESENSRWLETFSRFNIVSPVSTATKYYEGMDLIGKASGLPKELYEEFVISEKEKQRIKELGSRLIELIKNSNGEVFNPFMDVLSAQFPHEVGYRWRQYQRFNSLLTLHCLCYSNQRLKLLINGRKMPVITKGDIEWTIEIMKDASIIPPNKIQWFREIFIPGWKKCYQTVDFSRNQDSSLERDVATSGDIVKYIQEQGKGKTTTKQIRETYLETLLDNGLIEKDTDPRNRSRDVYWPSEGYGETIKSSLIATSSLDESCVSSCLEKYIKRRFSFEIEDKILSQEEIIPYILSKNVTQEAKIEPKNGSGEATNSGDFSPESTIG